MSCSKRDPATFQLPPLHTEPAATARVSHSTYMPNQQASSYYHKIKTLYSFTAKKITLTVPYIASTETKTRKSPFPSPIHNAEK